MAKAKENIGEINKCRACESRNLYSVLNLGNFFISKFYQSNKKPPRFPLEIMACENCSLLQLKHKIPKHILYGDDYGYYSGISQTMKDELRGIYENSVGICNLSDGDLVVDIGSNDATFLRNFPENVVKVGFDPVAKFNKYYEAKEMYFVPDYFNFEVFCNLFPKKKVKLITAIAVFYDLEEPNKFLQDVTKILDKKGIFVIQQNYLGNMLENCAFDNIVHEHVGYYSLTSLEDLLVRHGLEVFDVALSKINGGSFRTFVAKKNEFSKSDTVRKMKYREQKMDLEKMEIYKKFAKDARKLASELHELINRLTRRGQTVYLYGASTRGSTLLQYAGIDAKLIKKAAEKNPEKWGKIMSSVGIPIISEDEARQDHPDYFLVLPWFFREEFIEREKEYLQKGGKFIFPLPELEVFK